LYLFTKKSRKRSVLNRKDAKFKRQASIVQNRETVLDKDAFQFAGKTLFLGDLRALSAAGGLKIHIR